MLKLNSGSFCEQLNVVLVACTQWDCFCSQFPALSLWTAGNCSCFVPGGSEEHPPLPGVSCRTQVCGRCLAGPLPASLACTGHPQRAGDASQHWAPGRNQHLAQQLGLAPPSCVAVPECCSLLCLFPWVLISLLPCSQPSALCSLGVWKCILCLRSCPPAEGVQVGSSCPGGCW